MYVLKATYIWTQIWFDVALKVIANMDANRLCELDR